jgi:chromosome partitioning protein
MKKKHTIAVVNRKGGSGKSTTAATMAAELATRGHTVTLIDCDEERTITAWLSGHGGLLSDAVIPIDADTTPKSLQMTLNKITTDFVFIDVPPSHTDIARAAILLADHILIPSAPSPADVRGALATVKELHEANKAFKRPERTPMFVPTNLFPKAKMTNESLSAALSMHGKVLSGMTTRAIHSDVMLNGKTVAELSDKQPAKREVVALVNDFLKAIK